ncbi:MAG: 3-oxoacyl-ACP synthase, partial [Chloroflexota bacterium]|nr:3-oxoacyl-ACP synthase [Chloroflexota bacterium]
MAKFARVTGWGMYVPPKVMTNQDLEQMIDTSDTWIRRRTGIRERRIAGDNETASSMAVTAGKMALEVAHIDPSTLDLVITATVTPDQIFPACASLVQHALGAKKA